MVQLIWPCLISIVDYEAEILAQRYRSCLTNLVQYRFEIKVKHLFPFKSVSLTVD